MEKKKLKNSIGKITKIKQIRYGIRIEISTSLEDKKKHQEKRVKFSECIRDLGEREELAFQRL
jgi:hypothetical protein